VALPKGHSAARKRYVGLRDLEGEPLIMPSKDLLPGLHQMIATPFLKNHMLLGRYQMAEHFQTGSTLQRPVWDLCSFPLRQKILFLMGSCYELQVFLSDRWTRLLYGRVAMLTRLFTACLAFSGSQEGVVRTGPSTVNLVAKNLQSDDDLFRAEVTSTRFRFRPRGSDHFSA
jgi:hypothetical protein